MASGALGPDVFDVTPGPELTNWSGFALNLTSAVEKALGPDWKSKLASGGINTLTTNSGKFAAISIGSIFAGTLWINENLFAKYNLTPPATLSQWVNDCAVFKAHGTGCFVQGVASLGFGQDTLQEIADSVSPGTWTQAGAGARSPLRSSRTVAWGRAARPCALVVGARSRRARPVPGFPRHRSLAVSAPLLAWRLVSLCTAAS